MSWVADKLHGAQWHLSSRVVRARLPAGARAGRRLRCLGQPLIDFAPGALLGIETVAPLG